MGIEIDLLKNYPKSKRDINDRLHSKTESNRLIARKFGKEFFDGSRDTGYGGFNYHPRFWTNVVPDFFNHWSFKENSSILDVGCGKGFMLYDFLKKFPKLTIKGIDISEYAIKNSLEQIRKNLLVCNAKKLPFKSKSFDYVISINTIHNLEIEECMQAIKEIERVSKFNSFITVDAYDNEEEKKKMFAWNLTAKTILSTREWKKLFSDCGYTGDYFWFKP